MVATAWSGQYDEFLLNWQPSGPFRVTVREAVFIETHRTGQRGLLRPRNRALYASAGRVDQFSDRSTVVPIT